MKAQEAPAASRLLRRKEAADYLGIGISKLWELAQAGELKSVTLPSSGGKRPGRRFEQAELDRFIERNRTAS